MHTIISVVGARPNFMKAAPVALAFNAADGVEHILVHTGQHYDANMSDVFFEDLGLGKPDLYLGVGSGSHAEQTARVMTGFESVCLERRPSMVIVYGDVNSTLAASLVAAKLHIPVAHVEAGLRSFDRRMPEEINRIVADVISSLYFVTEESGRRNLLTEGVPADRVHFVGNTMIDSLASLCRRMGPAVGVDNYLVLTLHRPSNVDDPEQLVDLLKGIEEGGDSRIVFPVHPRTEAIMRGARVIDRLDAARWDIRPPAGYRDFIELVRSAHAVITDSGGIQEETTWLGVPCLTLRETTERPSTIELGTNVLVGIDPSAVRRAVADIPVVSVRAAMPQRPPLWDGHAAGRIVQHILQFLMQRV